MNAVNRSIGTKLPRSGPDDLSKDLLASLAISPFRNDPYMKVVQAYNATNNESPILPPRAPIAPPTILPPSPVLPPSPLFDPRDFFLPEEILPPQKRSRFLSFSSSNFSTLPQVIHVSYLYESRLLWLSYHQIFLNLCIRINAQDIEHMILHTPPRDIEPPVESPIPLSPSSSVGSSSPVRSTTPPPDYPFDESIFAKLDNSLWIIPQPLESEPAPRNLMSQMLVRVSIFGNLRFQNFLLYSVM
ncbi:hypothetical protein Tco_0829028 [Tanacetum coccineum]